MTRNINIQDGKILPNENYGINESCESVKLDDWTILLSNKRIIAMHPKANNEQPFVFHLADGVLNICDSGDNHYSYFRTAKLDKFMREFRLDTIVRENPNKQYFLETLTNNDFNTYYVFFTDGNVDVTEIKQKKKDSVCCHQIAVENATYVYYKQVNSASRNKRAISYKLHTELDAFELKPVLLKCKRLINRGRLGVFIIKT